VYWITPNNSGNFNVYAVLWEFAWKSASRIDVKSTKTTAYTCALASTMRNPKEPFMPLPKASHVADR
jgi:hypothetical protein